MKKVLSILLAMVMVLSMTTAAFAAPIFNGNDYAASTADVTVSNAAAETTAMNAYKVIAATYDSSSKSVTYSLTSWVVTALSADDGNGNLLYPQYFTTPKTGTAYLDVEKVAEALGSIIPSAGGQKKDTAVSPDPNAVLNILASAAKDNAIAGTKNGDDFEFAGLDVGAYFIVATDPKNIYNPMMVSVGLKASDAGLINDVVANRDINAKYTQIPFEKTVLGSTTGVNNGQAAGTTNPGINKRPANSKGDNTNIGDTVHFEIKNTVPTYGPEYHDILYKFADTMSNGLDFTAGSRQVYVRTKGDATTEELIPVGNIDEITVPDAEKGWAFKLKGDAYIRSLAGKEIVIRYDAVVNEDAATGFDPNTNTALLDYTTKPTGETNVLKDETYHYTFEIDGNVTKTGSWKPYGNEEWDVIGHELIKVGKDEYETKPLPSGQTITDPVTGKTYTTGHFTAQWEKDAQTYYNGGLKGAVFTLTNNETGKVHTATTTIDGYMNFVGLDAASYTLEEKSAPSGYSLDPTPHSVEITATHNDDGTLKSYSIKIDGKATTTYSATNSTKETDVQYAGTTYKGTTVIPAVQVPEDESTLLKNTPLVSLPSTGGMGTTLFTVAGCLIMIFAAGMFFVSRRKEER